MDDAGAGSDQFRLAGAKGGRLKLPRHRRSCDLDGLKDYAAGHRGEPLAVDLFSGAGGLSLGLSRAGFRLALGVDLNEYAVETHAAHFPGASVCADISSENALDRILAPLRGSPVALLAGGPPCQPFSKPIRWKRGVNASGPGSIGDHRRELWKSFLYAAESLRPAAILMENVPDIAVNEDGVILRSIFGRLEELGYSYDAKAYFAYDFGAGQQRQRIFVVAFRDGVSGFQWPEAIPAKQRSSLRDAIGDLPPITGGWNEEPPPYLGPQTSLQTRLRDGMDPDAPLYDHVTRGVRADDLLAFEMMSAKTRYDQLPNHLRRYSAETFIDKYNRLAWDEPCRTITAHMARDGYWYIHPDQPRSLSIREAARVQTFPDWFRFAGYPTSAFKQIGEAVAPFVAEGLGRAIHKALHDKEPARTCTTRNGALSELRTALAVSSDELARNSPFPWRYERSLWLNLIGEIVFGDRVPKAKARLFWANFRDDWPSPEKLLSDEHRRAHLRTLKRDACLPLLEQLARYMVSTKIPTLPELVNAGVSDRIARRALTFCGYSHERPNNPGLARLARRVLGMSNTQTTHVEAQIATGLILGPDEDAALYSAAIELSELVCTMKAPGCLLCPISAFCSYREAPAMVA